MGRLPGCEPTPAVFSGFRGRRCGGGGASRFRDGLLLRRGAFFHQAVMDAVERQLQAVGNAQLVVDLAQIILDHLLGGADLLGDFLVAHALRHARDNQQFLVAEPVSGAA